MYKHMSRVMLIMNEFVTIIQCGKLKNQLL